MDIINNDPQPVRIKYYTQVGGQRLGRVLVIPASGTARAGTFSKDVLESKHFSDLKFRNILRERKSRK